MKSPLTNTYYTSYGKLSPSVKALENQGLPARESISAIAPDGLRFCPGCRTWKAPVECVASEVEGVCLYCARERRQQCAITDTLARLRKPRFGNGLARRIRRPRKANVSYRHGGAS